MMFIRNRSNVLQGLLLTIGSAFFAVSSLVAAADYSPNFKNTEISEFINVVGKNLKKTIIVDPNVRGKITVRSYDLLNEEQYYQFFFKRAASLRLFGSHNVQWCSKGNTIQRCQVFEYTSGRR